VAEGGWDHAPGFAFRMGYTVVFDEATADFDLLRREPLVLARAGETRALPLAPGSGYDGEVRHAIALCTGRDDEPRATVDEAVGLTAMLEAEAAMLP
jgi:hypothetical protein